ncbi:MAG TPA: hypothetical protein VNK82_04560 [Terriglobales bacterium]|nr:hypothetical protein [Terriglobales bacterium]
MGQSHKAEESESPSKSPAASPSDEEPAPIADNSFLIEEAYNQEWGVVQHIQSFQRFWNSRDWTYTFTQEWPVNAAPRHQLSYTLAAGHAGALAGSGWGVGDLALNYRYQVTGDSVARIAFAPRVSLLLPTGDHAQGRGAGGVGVQTNLPLSFRATRRLVTHWNAGATFIPNAKNEAGAKAFVAGYNLGQSFVWLAHPRVNVMWEAYWSSMDGVVGPGMTQRENTLLLSPGIRWAHNFSNGLQIVPGIAVPFGVGPSGGEKGLILYLSLEHPFRKKKDGM